MGIKRNLEAYAGHQLAYKYNDGAMDILAVGLFNHRAYFGNSVSSSTISYLDLTTQSSALLSLESLQSQLTRVTSELGRLGAMQSRLGYALNNLEVQRENYLAAGSRIEDVDIAIESGKLVKNRLLQFTASKILGQANIQSELVIKLLKN